MSTPTTNQVLASRKRAVEAGGMHLGGVLHPGAWHAAHPEYKPLPIQTHSIMLVRTKQALANLGVTSFISYAD